MRKLVLLVLSFVLPTVMVIGCAPAPTPIVPKAALSPVSPTVTPEPASNQQTSNSQEASKSPIPILVSPFYYWDGIQIHVGNYSEELGTGDLQELNVLAQEMAKHRDELTPEQMFVLAIRLYDLGDKDTSVYWFYEAQFRAKLFLKTLDPTQITGTGDRSLKLLTDYDAFTERAGKYINGYAGCDVDNWVKIARVVKDDNATPPELDRLFPNAIFIERAQWQGINNDVGAGLGVLIDRLVEQKQAIRQDRVANNLDDRYCK